METSSAAKEIAPNTSKNIFFVGLLSFFGGISQDSMLPILPLYLANVLGFSKEVIGIAEGLVTSASSMFKIVSGIASDRWKSRKTIVFIGYFFSCIARPLLALTSSVGGIFFLRFLDGVGKGIKDSPKDALVADSTKTENRGKGFGIVRALDTFGSVVGPLLLAGFFFFFPGRYALLFLLTAIPLIATLGIILFGLKETPFRKKEVSSEHAPLPFRFYLFLAIVLLFSLGNSSDTFLILRAQNIGLTLFSIPLLYALFNAVYAAASIPLGSLSDRIGRPTVILIGWVAYALAYAGFAYAHVPLQIWVLFAFYGVYYATTEGVAKALVADLIPRDRRGTAYGIYNTAVGLATLPASILAGYLWDHVSPATPFMVSAGIALLASLFLFLFFRRQPHLAS